MHLITSHKVRVETNLSSADNAISADSLDTRIGGMVPHVFANVSNRTGLVCEGPVHTPRKLLVMRKISSAKCAVHCVVCVQLNPQVMTGTTNCRSGDRTVFAVVGWRGLLCKAHRTDTLSTPQPIHLALLVYRQKIVSTSYATKCV